MVSYLASNHYSVATFGLKFRYLRPPGVQLHRTVGLYTRQVDIKSQGAPRLHCSPVRCGDDLFCRWLQVECDRVRGRTGGPRNICG